MGHTEIGTGLPQLILRVVVGSGVMAIATILAFVVWWSQSMNHMAADNSRQLFENTLVLQEERLRRAVQAFANRSETYDFAQSRNSHAIYEHYAPFVKQSDMFDVLFILDSDGVPLFGANDRGSDHQDSGHAAFELQIMDQLRNALHRQTNDQNDDVYATVKMGQYLYFVSVIRITDNETAHLDALNAQPLLIGAIRVDQKLWAHVDHEFVIGDVTLVAPGDPVPAGALTKVLRDPNGTLVATLAWDAPKPGTQLMLRALPIIIAVSGLIIFGVCIVGRALSRHSKAFLYERSIARKDPLTGLLNRKGLDDALATPRVQNALADGHLALLNIDLNDFKWLNDNLGHKTGDLALIETADRLRDATRSIDVLVRLGGDEFLVLLIGQHPEASASHVTRRLQNSTVKALRLPKGIHYADAAIGVAIASKAQDWDVLMAKADADMYAQKQLKRGSAA